jgi:CheY-like chemotaxis protein
MASINPTPLVLIVDDEEPVRELYRKYLELSTGMMVVGAGTAQDALDKLERVQPDVIVLDVALPDMSGLKLLDRLRSHPTCYRVPVVLLTGHDLAGKPEAAARVFSKPLRPEELEREILQLTREGRAARAARA